MSKRNEERKAEALAALDANGGNVNHTARQLGISESTLRGWAKRAEEGAESLDPARVAESSRIREIREQKREELSDRLETLAHQLIDCIPEKLEVADLKGVATTLGIALDKMRLLREQPTAIQQTNELTEEQRAQRIAELLQRAGDRQAAAVAHPGRAPGTGAVGASPLH